MCWVFENVFENLFQFHSEKLKVISEDYVFCVRYYCRLSYII